MLAIARRSSGQNPQHTFVEGDMRSFDLCDRFDAVVCMSDSLNYLAEPGQLRDVFRCVSRHLKPRGVFVFDILCHACFEMLDGTCLHHLGEHSCFVMSFQYDRETRRERTLVTFPDAVETHHRIPLNYGDVEMACTDTSLRVYDFFTGLLGREFFTLQRL
jgi:SAM-dependent methyltransferase